MTSRAAATDERRLAEKQVSYGYFQGAGHVWQTCPRCRESVVASHAAWATTQQRCEALRSAIEQHLADEHAAS